MGRCCIIAILAGVIFLALNPLKRFQDARDAHRWTEVEELLHAIKIDQIDNRGSYLPVIANLPDNETWMISATNTATTSCNLNCGLGGVGKVTVSSSTACVDLSGLVDEGYISKVPISPSASDLLPQWSSTFTGYTISKTDQYLTISACEGESDELISSQIIYAKR